MLPFRKIVFPVDYSEPCQAVAPYVREMALRYSAELTAVHAYAPLDAIVHSELLVTDPELKAKAHASEEGLLRQFIGRLFPGLPVECFAQLGEPGDVIDKFTQEQPADLVMLATRGHGPVRRFLLGSITAKVLHDVGAAVWTGAGATLPDHPVNIPYRSIVCALDESDEAEAVLRASASIASTYQAQLWILHVVPTPPAYPDVDLEEHTRQLTKASESRLQELKAKLGVDAPHSVIDTLLADGIHQEVVRRRADLLITGRGRSTGTFSRLWSHLYAIIRDSPCPVLSI
jgi:nucleotide-binding universal stress UspA family protein